MAGSERALPSGYTSHTKIKNSELEERRGEEPSDAERGSGSSDGSGGSERVKKKKGVGGGDRIHPEHARKSG